MFTIQRAAAEFELAVREAVGTNASYRLTIETADVDAYWVNWLDGAGDQVRLRLNRRNLSFTQVKARQFALHEILGHALQYASFAQQCAAEEVPWVRLLSVYAPHQVQLEGLAQALPLFVASGDQALMTRFHLDHYLELVKGQLHAALVRGESAAKCADYARSHVPFWSDDFIGSLLTDRGADPLLRSYLWAYPAGLDWFAALSGAAPKTVARVLQASYRAPLTPTELAELWPDGPYLGGFLR